MITHTKKDPKPSSVPPVPRQTRSGARIHSRVIAAIADQQIEAQKCTDSVRALREKVSTAIAPGRYSVIHQD